MRIYSTCWPATSLTKKDLVLRYRVGTGLKPVTAPAAPT